MNPTNNCRDLSEALGAAIFACPTVASLQFSHDVLLCYCEIMDDDIANNLEDELKRGTFIRKEEVDNLVRVTLDLDVLCLPRDTEINKIPEK